MSKRSIRAGFGSDLLKQPLLPISMVLIFAYLYFNAIYEGFSINDNLRIEDCCIPEDKCYYRWVFWTLSALWVLLVFLIYGVHCCK